MQDDGFNPSTLWRRLQFAFFSARSDTLLDPERRAAMRTHLRTCRPRVLGRAPVEQSRFVVIDTETTGLKAYAGDEVISIALIELQGLEPTGRIFTSLVNPQRPIPATSTAIHHLTDADVRDAPCLERLLPDIVQFIGDSIVVGHHVQFDLRFLNKRLWKLCRCRLRQPSLDTMMLYVALTGRLGHYTLEEVAQQCRVEIVDRHTAYGDAVATAAIFKRLSQRLEAGHRPVSRLIQRQSTVGRLAGWPS